jgi:hypothetical protein
MGAVRVAATSTIGSSPPTLTISSSLASDDGDDDDDEDKGRVLNSMYRWW